MVSKCRNIWDTMRGDVSSICSPTHSYHADAVSAKPSGCQAEQQPLASNSSRRNCGMIGEKSDQKHQHDALKTSEQPCWSLISGQSCSTVLETVCLHENKESSSKLTASNSMNTGVSGPSFSKTPLCANRDVACSKGNDSLVQSTRLFVHHRDTNVLADASLTAKTNSLLAPPSTDKLDAVQMQEYSRANSSPSVLVSMVKVSSVNHLDAGTVPERQKQSNCCGVSDSWRANSRVASQGGVNELFTKNCTIDSHCVDTDVGFSVGQIQDTIPFVDRLPVPDIVLSAARTELSTARTKPKHEELSNGHDVNSETVKHSPTDLMKRSQTVTVPVLGNSCSLNFFKCRSPVADFETESLSDAGDIPLFSSPFDVVTVNDNSSFDSVLPVFVASPLGKGSASEDVSSGVCDLISYIIRSNLSSKTSLLDILEDRKNDSAVNGGVQDKDLGHAEGQAATRFVTDSKNFSGSTDVCDNAKVNAYVAMLENNAYRKLQFFYTSSKNLNNLSFPDRKSDSEMFPDCCDEGFVESPITTDNAVQFLSELGAVGSSQMPAKVFDNNVFKSARTLMNDETDSEFASDEIQSAVERVLCRLEADALRERNALLETNVTQDMSFLSKRNEQKLTEPLTSTLLDHSKHDNDSVEKTRVSKSECAVEISVKKDVLEVNTSSLSLAEEKVTSSDESRVADVNSGNSLHNFRNDVLPRYSSVFESVGKDHEIGVANLDANQTQLANKIESDFSQHCAKTTFRSLQSNQRKCFDETETMGICSKLLPASSELSTTVCFSSSRISENAVSPCTSVLETSEYLTSALTLPSQDRLISLTNVTKVSHDSVADLNDTCCVWQTNCPFETRKPNKVLSSDFKTDYDLLGGSEFDGCHSSGDSSWGDKSCDTFSETSRGRSEEGPANSKSEQCSGFADKRKTKFSRQPRLLNEIANTAGFVGDKRESQRSDSLFIDSKLLSREERVLQMVHMQMTKMEVQAELTKLKKTKSFSETAKKGNRSESGGPKSGCHFATTRPQVQRRIKGRMSKFHQQFSQRQKLHNDRIRQRNAWSSRAVGFTELRSVAMPSTRVKACWAERKKSTASMKSATALGASHGGHFLNSLLKTESRGLGRQRSTVNDNMGQKLAVSWADAGLLMSKSSTFGFDATLKRTDGSSNEHASMTKPAKSEDVSNYYVNHFSSAERGRGLSTPTVPSEVKRLLACHNTGETVLHKAARLGYHDIVLWCCQSRYVDIDATDNAGYTPLHESCIGSEVRIAKYLLHYGANVNSASGVDGRRPIHEAVDSDSLEMVRLLLSAGADINLTTYSGKTAQDLAKSLEMKEFIEAYLDDLNNLQDGDKEIVWDLAPVWNGVSDECGMDMFYDVPLSDPKSEEFYVECCNRPL